MRQEWPQIRTADINAAAMVTTTVGAKKVSDLVSCLGGGRMGRFALAISTKPPRVRPMREPNSDGIAGQDHGNDRLTTPGFILP